MSINHGRIYIFMIHEFMVRSNIISSFQKMCCKTMPERVAAWLSHEKIGALEKGKEVMDLFASQDNWQSSLLPCSDSISQIAQVFLQDIPEKIQ